MLLDHWPVDSIRDIGAPLFRAGSAGSKPTGRVHPLALEQIQALTGSDQAYRSKSWREFTRPPRQHRL